MDSSDDISDWRLKLRYGQLKTPFTHCTVIARGRIVAPHPEFNTTVGNAYMGMKVWASSYDEAADMTAVIGKELGFIVRGKIEVFNTAPEQPPRDKPHGYSINFTPFRDDEEQKHS